MLNKKLNIDDFNIYFISGCNTSHNSTQQYTTLHYRTLQHIYKVDIKIINVTYQKEDK